jgi:UDP-N-acetylmuramate--alanine ligase
MSLIARTRKVHFVGIGGIGMSGLAEILLRSGHQVTGSDQSDSDMVQHLRKLGAEIQKGHDAGLVERRLPDVVVYSTAIAADNAELAFARRLEIPIIRRAEMLAELMRLRRGIAIAGSHGKTTTTGLVSLILKEAGLDPAVVIGGRFDAIGSNAAWGSGAWLVAEADESDGSFLRLAPEMAVVTNIDREHLNHYGSFEATLSAFEEFLDRLPFYGRAVLSSDCPKLRAMGVQLRKPRYWYGTEAAHEPDFLVETDATQAEPEFRVLKRQKTSSTYEAWLSAKLKVPGLHNVMNATAAAIVARELEIPTEVIARALSQFIGVRRRFERRGLWKGHMVIEDYGHHPTEIRATLQACRAAYPVAPAVVFQPHRYSRTRDCWEDFGTCFEQAGSAFTLPIYAASEPREVWVDKYDNAAFARNVKGPEAAFCPDLDHAVSALEEAEATGKIPKGAPILVLGAGDVAKLIPKLVPVS